MATFAGQSGGNPKPERNQEPIMTVDTHTITELAFRESNGIAVSLVWNRTTDGITVIVSDAGGSFEIPAPAAKAMDVFKHPYAYAPDALAA
jgi:hypothetical protein